VKNVTSYPFDERIDRRVLHSAKWSFFDEDVLPLWVADMDFAAPPEVVQAIKARADARSFGYEFHAPELGEVVAERNQRLYDWAITPEDIVYVPGMVLALNLAAQTFGKPGDAILMQTPVYGPFLNIPTQRGRYASMIDLVNVADGDNTFHYEIDFDAFEAAIGPQTSLFFLCNPHNPGGRVFDRDELIRLAEICLKHDILIISDEIHSDLIFEGHTHTPIASLSPEIAAKTITLAAPSKTYNLPGLVCSMAIATDKDLRQRFNQAVWGMGAHVNTFGFTGALAAYREGDPWLKAALDYMQANRDFMVQYITDHMPMLKTTVPEGTYLAWVDCSALAFPEGQTAHDFFLKQAKVALNPGAFFGDKSGNFVRLNFACPRSVLQEALDRMQAAIAEL